MAHEFHVHKYIDLSNTTFTFWLHCTYVVLLMGRFGYVWKSFGLRYWQLVHVVVLWRYYRVGSGWNKRVRSIWNRVVLNVIWERALMRKRVTVVVCVCVCLLSHISPLERLLVLIILSRTQRTMEVKKFVGISLKALHSKVMTSFAYPCHPTRVLQRHFPHFFDGRAL